MIYIAVSTGKVLAHYGILGQKWGVRRYQNEDGTLTEAGKRRYKRMVEFSDHLYEGGVKRAKKKLANSDNARTKIKAKARIEYENKLKKLRDKQIREQNDLYEYNMYRASRIGGLTGGALGSLTGGLLNRSVNKKDALMRDALAKEYRDKLRKELQKYEESKKLQHSSTTGYRGSSGSSGDPKDTYNRNTHQNTKKKKERLKKFLNKRRAHYSSSKSSIKRK